MSFIEQQPDNRLYMSNDVYHITPVIDRNKFEPHNYNLRDLLELGETGLLQYQECTKANIPSPYLEECKNGLYKMYKALGYHSFTNNDALDLKTRIESELNLKQLLSTNEQHNNMFSDITRDNMHESRFYANKHTDVFNADIPKYHKEYYEKLMQPR